MYREYRIKCSFKKRKCLTEWKYRFIFNTEYNLRFGRLKVDTCHKCDAIEANLQSKTRLSISTEIIKVREEQYSTVNKTNNDNNEYIKHACDAENEEKFLIFDLHRALEVPPISFSNTYYKRELWCFTKSNHTNKSSNNVPN